MGRKLSVRVTYDENEALSKKISIDSTTFVLTIESLKSVIIQGCEIFSMDANLTRLHNFVQMWSMDGFPPEFKPITCDADVREMFQKEANELKILANILVKEMGEKLLELMGQIPIENDPEADSDSSEHSPPVPIQAQRIGAILDGQGDGRNDVTMNFNLMRI